MKMRAAYKFGRTGSSIQMRLISENPKAITEDCPWSQGGQLALASWEMEQLETHSDDIQSLGEILSKGR